MSQRCTNPNCYAHEGELCALGEHTPSVCSAWSETAQAAESANATAMSARVPWSGSALGLTDLANLTPRSRHILVGVMGAHDAGKTTLLTGAYLHLLRGGDLAGARFAGSHSLGAWESLASSLRFDDAARSPSFPPHTPRGIHRVPGLLHLAMRGTEDTHRDVFLTDAPGEWFTRWATNQDAPDAEGARWTERHADVFLVVADCQRLSGPDRGAARNNTRQLIERLRNHVGKRPTLLVWAKSDHRPPESLQQAIRNSLRQSIPHAEEIDTTTNQPETLVAALGQIIQAAWHAPKATPIEEPVCHPSPFSAYRRPHAHA